MTLNRAVASQAGRQFASQFATTAGGVKLAAGVLAGLAAGRADLISPSNIASVMLRLRDRVAKRYSKFGDGK
jgi:hypothetical protein